MITYTLTRKKRKSFDYEIKKKRAGRTEYYFRKVKKEGSDRERERKSVGYIRDSHKNCTTLVNAVIISCNSAPNQEIWAVFPQPFFFLWLTQGFDLIPIIVTLVICATPHQCVYMCMWGWEGIEKRQINKDESWSNKKKSWVKNLF